MMLGDVIKEYRKEKGLSLRCFADRIGCSYEYIRLIEVGRRRKPNYELLSKVANEMNISFGELTSMLEVPTVQEEGLKNEKDIEKDTDNTCRRNPNSIRRI